MSVPYDAPTVARLLRAMPDDRLATVLPVNFQTWPAKITLKADVLTEMIRNEKSRRRK